MTRLGVDDEGRPGAGTPPFRVAAIEARETSRNAPAPYTTSTLQQDASTRLRFSPKRTMTVAQQLYEGVELGAEGSVGLITYMRTDSPRISELARSAAEHYVGDAFGKNYVRKGSRPATSKGPVQAQDAHEAVRPTEVGP